MWLGSSFKPILSIESVPSDASSVEGAVETVDGVPITPVCPSESCAGAAMGATRGDEVGLSMSPTPSCVPIEKTVVDWTVLSSPSLFFPSADLPSILPSRVQDVSEMVLCPILDGP